MRAPNEIAERIAKIESEYEHVLTGSVATVQVNAPRAIMQVDATARLEMLHWVLGKKYKTKLKGINT